MKKLILLPTILLLAVSLYAQQTRISWVATTAYEPWKKQQSIPLINPTTDTTDVEIDLNHQHQTIEGFGTCFNELGWTSLSFLSAKNRGRVMRELFAPGVGANFTLCRMPVGANDFSRGWYSYDETDGDFDMKHFSIANDQQTLIPFIRTAQKYSSGLRLWASPWSPPSWMKYNHHYAGRSVLGNTSLQSEEYGIDMRGINNGLPADKEGREGKDMFIQEEKYYQAYALYFARFIEAYKNQGIKIDMVMPQNEFNSAQPFPSCTWTAAGLSKFIPYLGARMKPMGVNVFFGTMERANPKLADTVLTDTTISKFISGVGLQWAGKAAIPIIHEEHPELSLYETEQECGNGKNDWKYCVYTWGLMKHYLGNGANAYMYWNTSLKQGGISTWGWKQNSLIVIDTVTRTYTYNYEYYLMKHLSHFVKQGAKRVNTVGGFDNLLAFVNLDGSIVLIIYNEKEADRQLHIKIGTKTLNPLLQASSFNTILIER